MDDRHSFSDPRVAAFGYHGSSKPTWEVDVYRKGVDHPVFTLIVNDDTLPPRMRKKKVVWRLPRDHETLPNFGSDEKRRLVDLFKEQKKSRRKSNKRLSVTGGPPQENVPLNPAEDPPEMVKKDDVLKERSKKDDRKDKKEADNPGPKVHPAPPQDKGRALPPPGLSMPPGLESPSTVSTSGSSPPSTASRSPPVSLEPLSLNDSATPTTANRFFSVPLTSCNIPVDLAQIFMDMYYCSMTHGQQEDLLLRYVKEGAVKSLSLGGAHSFCKTHQEILLQLNSLQDSLWDVSGVVAQEGFANSVVLLLTGTCLPKTSPQPLPFCHSITLIQIQPGCYQIHNDAMSLMTIMG